MPSGETSGTFSPRISSTLEIPGGPELRLILERLKAGAALDDAYFDKLFPTWARKHSKLHFTPVEVARRAAELLAGNHPDARILDVGSGIGKFCIIAALTTPGRFFGIEQRWNLLAVSRLLLRQHRIPRVTLIEGDVRNEGWTKYTGFYFFNPFQEHTDPFRGIDREVTLLPSLFREYVEHTEQQLARMPTGTRVVTYHGFGGTFPPGYEKILSEHRVRGTLEYWEKVS